MIILVGISGASGAIYGIEFLKYCAELSIETHLVISKWGEKTIEIETPYSVNQVKEMASINYDINNLAAKMSSGSFLHDGMVIAPCSMKTLAAIAYGISDNLIHRAADVTIKEGRKLVMVTRETPLSAIHLENMLKMSRIGAHIFPPVPAMYVRPESIDDIVRQSVSKIFDLLGIPNSISARWYG